MVSNTHKRFLFAAQLGLRGEREALLNFLQEVAIDEINKNHYEIHHSLMQLLEEEGIMKPSLSHSSVDLAREEVIVDIDVKNVWLNSSLQKRVEKLLQFFRKTANDKDRQNLKRI